MVGIGGSFKEDNIYSIAPNFDNGSCLFPNLTDEDEMQMIINDAEETKRRVYTFPTSQILLHDKKSSYYEFISDIQKEFYKHIVLQRFNLIIKESYERLIESEKACN